jgi:hypothetical protein
MMRRGKTDKLKAGALEASALAMQLAQDRKFRKRLVSALEHSSKAGRRTRRDLGLRGAARRVAADQALHAELRAARNDLQKAYARVDAKRRGKRRKLFLVAAAGTLAAVPRVRETFKAAVAKAPQGAEAARDAASDLGARLPGTGSTRPRSLQDLSRDELYARAQEADIPGRSEMSKDQLVAALRSRS